jgi:predicted nucleotidyltransferase
VRSEGIRTFTPRRSGVTVKPMHTAETLSEYRDAILAIASRYGAQNVRVFGSVARGDADDASDIDFLVDLPAGKSLLDLGGLVVELGELLGRPVDVVTPRGLKERIRDRVLAEAVSL